MRIKLDENLPLALVPFLQGQGHDVDTVEPERLIGRADHEVWKAAQDDERFLITQDLDFSDVRKYEPGSHMGLLLIRLSQPGRLALANRVATLFASEAVEQWQRCLVVATEHKVRVRHPKYIACREQPSSCTTIRTNSNPRRPSVPTGAITHSRESRQSARSDIRRPRRVIPFKSPPGRQQKRRCKAMPRAPKTTPSADEIAEKASRGEDVSAHFTNTFTVIKPVHRVNVDLTQGMLRELDERAARLNVSRQAIIKMLLDRALAKDRTPKRPRKST